MLRGLVPRGGVGGWAVSLGTVTPGLYGAINPSSGTTQETGAYLVRWLDRLGNVVASTGADAGQSFAAPQVPTVSGLTNGRWSEAATLISGDMDILPLYDTSDGKGHVFIEASALLGLTATVKVEKTDGSTLLIEWGDGTTDTSAATGAVTVTHLYAAGSFEAKFSISVGAGEFSMGHGTTGNPFVAGVAVTELWMRSTATTVPAYSLNGTAFRTMVALVGANGVTSVGDYALLACYAIKQCALPECHTIGVSSFQTCYTISSIYAPKCTSVGASGLIATTSLRLLNLPECTSFGASASQFSGALEYVWLRKCTNLGATAFQSCYALREIYLDVCTSMGASALLSNSMLTYVYAPLCATIGTSAISGCAILADVSLPGAVTVGTQALQSLRSVVKITIGPNCTTISSLAFDSARNLRTLRIEATTPPVLASSASLADFDPRLVIQVPLASLAAYQSASNWSTFAARMVGY